MLVEETPRMELSKEAWFYDVPASMEGDFLPDNTGDGEMEIHSHEYKSGRASATRAGLRRREQVYSLEHSVPIQSEEAFQQNGGIRELLHSYLNTRQGAGNIVAQSALQIPINSPVATDAGFDRSRTNISIAGRKEVDEVLSRAVNLVMQPTVNERGLMTFSILGLGEFALIGGRSGMTLALGEFFSVSVMGGGSEVVLPGIFGGGASSMAEVAVAGAGGLQPSLAGYATETVAGSMGADGNVIDRVAGDGGEIDGDGRSAKPGGELGGKSRFPRLLVLISDIVTYPGTIIAVLGLLLLQLVKLSRRLQNRRTKLPVS